MLSIILEKMLKESIHTMDDFDYDVVNNEPIHIYLKDKNGKYINANQAQIRDAGFTNSSDFIGNKDSELCWKQFSHYYQYYDKNVMTQNKVIHCVEPGILANKQYIKCISVKTPLKSRMGKAIGVMGITFCEFVNNENAIKQIEPLSPQQIKCLYYLGKGKTSKQIAVAMHLSPRTVEHYIENIKIKLNCLTREEVIAKSFEMGIHNNHPIFLSE